MRQVKYLHAGALLHTAQAIVRGNTGTILGRYKRTDILPRPFVNGQCSTECRHAGFDHRFTQRKTCFTS